MVENFALANKSKLSKDERRGNEKVNKIDLKRNLIWAKIVSNIRQEKSHAKMYFFSYINEFALVHIRQDKTNA